MILRVIDIAPVLLVDHEERDVALKQVETQQDPLQDPLPRMLQLYAIVVFKAFPSMSQTVVSTVGLLPTNATRGSAVRQVYVEIGVLLRSANDAVLRMDSEYKPSVGLY